MPISRDNAKKSPNQNPVDFYKSEQAGGARGQTTQRVPDELTGGPQREKVMGKKELGKQ